MDVMDEYSLKISKNISKIKKNEKINIKKVAELIAEHIAKDKLLYIYGPGGHSNIAAMEIFFRAGGLMHVSPILDGGTLLNQGALRSGQMERLNGYGKIVINNNDIKEGDLIIICNAFGINSAAIEAALTAKENGAKVIGISSHEHAMSIPDFHPARHSSKKNLHEVVDFSINNNIDIGDASIKIEFFENPVGPISTFSNSYILNSIVMEAIKIMVSKGVDPPVWMSNNLVGGDEKNKKFIKRFKNRIRML